MIFFKNEILENEVSHMYLEPNMVPNCMASVLQLMYYPKHVLPKNIQFM